MAVGSALVAGRHRVWIRAFPLTFGGEQRVRRLIRGAMEFPVERRLLDQDMVDEQLPADVDVDHRGGEARYGGRYGRVVQLVAARRPRAGKDDAVVECVSGCRRLPVDGSGAPAPQPRPTEMLVA